MPFRSAAIGLALALVAAAAFAGCGGGGKKTTTSASSSGGCTTVSKPKPKPPVQLGGNPPALNPTVPYPVRVETNCGDFTITLDVHKSPQTSASFVYLVRQGYFDGTIFHRIVPGFVIQGGDPTQKGSGGPGYSTVEPPPQDIQYTKGTVAMAKAGAEAPGTAGSQFFIVTAPNAQLPADYALLGKVTDGQDVVERIGKLGDPATEEPTETVEIEKMSLVPAD